MADNKDRHSRMPHSSVNQPMKKGGGGTANWGNAADMYQPVGHQHATIATAPSVTVAPTQYVQTQPMAARLSNAQDFPSLGGTPVGQGSAPWGPGTKVVYQVGSPAQTQTPASQGYSPSSGPNSPNRIVVSPPHMAGAGLSPQQVGNVQAAKLPASNEQTIQFPPGMMGLDINDDGTVDEVDDGPGKDNGVQVGWRVVKIEGKTFTCTQDLRDARAEGKPYNITFATSQEQPVDNKQTAANTKPAKEVRADAKPAVKQVASKEQTIRFPAGRMCLEISERGDVDAVDDGPAKEAGVQAGWRIAKIDGKAFDFDLLRETTHGDNQYVITFNASEISPSAIGA